MTTSLCKATLTALCASVLLFSANAAFAHGEPHGRDHGRIERPMHAAPARHAAPRHDMRGPGHAAPRHEERRAPAHHSRGHSDRVGNQVATVAAVAAGAALITALLH